jgi:hypothetical protein
VIDLRDLDDLSRTGSAIGRRSVQHRAPTDWLPHLVTTWTTGFLSGCSCGTVALPTKRSGRSSLPWSRWRPTTPRSAPSQLALLRTWRLITARSLAIDSSGRPEPTRSFVRRCAASSAGRGSRSRIGVACSHFWRRRRSDNRGRRHDAKAGTGAIVAEPPCRRPTHRGPSTASGDIPGL